MKGLVAAAEVVVARHVDCGSTHFPRTSTEGEYGEGGAVDTLRGHPHLHAPLHYMRSSYWVTWSPLRMYSD